MNHLRKLGLASFRFLGLGLFCGTAGVRLGWTPSTALTVNADLLRRRTGAGAHRFHAIAPGQSLNGTTKLNRFPLPRDSWGLLEHVLTDEESNAKRIWS